MRRTRALALASNLNDLAVTLSDVMADSASDASGSPTSAVSVTSNAYLGGSDDPAKGASDASFR